MKVNVENKSAKTKRNGSIDIFRLVISIVIISIHYGQSYRPYELIANSVARLGVPFFFLVTGFFFFKRSKVLDEFQFKTGFAYVKKMVILWCVWSLICSYKILTTPYDSRRVIIRLFRSLWGLNFFAPVLWYLIAAAEGLIIVYYINAKTKGRLSIPIFIVSLLICLLGSSYGNLLVTYPSLQRLYIFLAPQTSVITAVLWYCVAIFIVKNLPHLVKFGKVIFLIGSGIIWYMESFILHRYGLVRINDIYITLIVISVVLFVFLVTHPIRLSEKIDKLLCEFSLYIYIVQNLAGDFVTYILTRSRNTQVMNGPFFLIQVIFVDVLIAIIVVLFAHSRVAIFLKTKLSL